MRKGNRQRPQHRASHGGPQPAGHMRAVLHIGAQIIGPEHRLHQPHGHQTGQQAKDHKGRQFDVEHQCPFDRQGKFCNIAQMDAADHRPRDRRNHDRRKGMNGKVAQHHLKREQRPRNRCVERHRNRRRHSAPQQIAPRDAVGVDPVRHPAGNHRCQMHHRPLAPAGPARSQRDHRGKRAGDALFLLNPAFMHGRAFDHIRD